MHSAPRPGYFIEAAKNAGLGGGLIMKKMIFYSKEKINIIAQDSIMFFKSDNCYTSVNLATDSELIICKSLMKIGSDLDSTGFIRISQSYIINVNYIKTIHKKQKLIEMSNGIKLPFTITIKMLLTTVNHCIGLTA